MRHLILEVPEGATELDLPREVARRLRKVLRLRDGAEVPVLDPSGSRRAMGTLASGDHLSLGPWEPLGPDPHPPVCLYLPPLKADLTERAARSLFELGLRELVLASTARSQLEPPPRLLRRLEAAAHAASEQSGRLHLPTIRAGELPEAWGEPGATLVLHPGGEPFPATLEGPTTLVLGPEGGLTDDEVEAARAAGARVVGLGGHVLRAETAAITAATLALRAHGWL
jgi:16S rRNA (uracil1498-N3)-methyltransferase